MKTVKVLQVRGVTPEAQRAMRMAIAEKGVTAGPWLSEAILRFTDLARAEELGVKFIEKAEAHPPKIPETPGAELPVIGIGTGEPPRLRKYPRPVSERRQAQIDRKKQCGHGIAKGFNCWKCGGLAKIQPE